MTTVLNLQRYALVILMFFILLPQAVSALEPIPPPAPPPARADQLWLRGLKPIPVEKIGPGLFQIGDIKINKEQRSISFPATVNMEKGLLEYVLVRSGGKVHESLLRTASEPYNLQLAFLLLGFEGTDHPLMAQGDPAKPKGDGIQIEIVYVTADDKPIALRPEQWAVIKRNSETKDVGILDWVYTGSITVKGRFLAQSDGSIIALYHDPIAMVDNASPGGESDKVWFVKEGALPPVGTPVTVTIKAKK